MKLKVLTYNIHKGFDWNNKNYFIKAIKNLVQKSCADIVFLQEVVGENNQYQKRGLIDAQFEYIADSVWPHYSYGKNSVFDHGHHGNLILSQYPIKKWEFTNISTNPFEKRGLLFCEIDIGKQSLYVICLHLNLLNGGRNQQYKMIKKYLQALNIPESAPVILAGDFNDWNKQASKVFEVELQMKEVHKAQHGLYAKTFPALAPILSLDRIYTKNLNILQAQILPATEKTHFSDHLPLYCELEFL